MFFFSFVFTKIKKYKYLFRKFLSLFYQHHLLWMETVNRTKGYKNKTNKSYFNNYKSMEIVKTNGSKGWKNVLKIVIPYLIFVGIFQAIGMLIAGVDFRHFSDGHQTSVQLSIIYFMSMLGTVGIVWLFRKKADKKTFTSIGFIKGSIRKDLIFGCALGFVIMLVGYTVLILTKQIEYVDIQFNAVNLMNCFGLFAFVAIAEEVFARGYILNNLMVSFDKYVALVISALIFSAMHIANSNVNIIGLIIIFLSGIALGLPYIYTKKLWFPIALHFSWNFFQGPIFGFNVSGIEIPTLLVTKYNTANIWNGGKFGFEGSVVSAVLLVLAILLIYILFRNRVPSVQEELIVSDIEINN